MKQPRFPAAASRQALRPALLAASALIAAPASAQYYPGPGYYPGPYSYNAPPPPAYYGRPYYGDEPMQAGPRPISPQAVVDRLEDQGYEDVGRPRFTGTVYVVDATAPGDMRMRVVVDAIRGIVLNRTALGERRRFQLREELEEDRDDVAARRYGARPDDPAPYGSGYPAPGRVEMGPAPRDLSRAPEPGSSARVLPEPSDPRVAPTPGETRTPFEGRAGGREAARTEPQVRRPAPAEPSSRPYGLNPEGAAPAKRKPPVEQARRPEPSGGQPTGVPEGRPSAAKPTDGSVPTAEAARPNRPVRVIGGVTPLNSGGATGGGGAAGAGPAGGGAAQLDSLPPPPAAPQPGATE